MKDRVGTREQISFVMNGKPLTLTPQKPSLPVRPTSQQVEEAELNRIHKKKEQND